MTIAEIFQKLDYHSVEGLMTHAQLADYFDFLNLHGYKRLHEYHYLDESICHRGICRYFINHYNMLIPQISVGGVEVIPSTWYMHSRKDVDSATRKKAVATAFDTWVNWERDTKMLYENLYKEACAIGEIASAMKIKDMICNVDQELKYAERMCMELKSVDYDQVFIAEQQKCLHEEYKEKTKSLGIDIC